ncbi:unnamed protein product [Ectocarpus sp. 6 AP-2014]
MHCSGCSGCAACCALGQIHAQNGPEICTPTLHPTV